MHWIFCKIYFFPTTKIRRFISEIFQIREKGLTCFRSKKSHFICITLSKVADDRSKFNITWYIHAWFFHTKLFTYYKIFSHKMIHWFKILLLICFLTSSVKHLNFNQRNAPFFLKNISFFSYYQGSMQFSPNFSELRGEDEIFESKLKNFFVKLYPKR